MTDDLLLSDAELAELGEEELAEYHAVLRAELEELRRRSRWIPRPKQVPPDWSWFVWLILAGRGWGKTRTGAEWVVEKARRYPGARIALVGQTFQDGRDTMVEGESGILEALEDHELAGGDRERAWNRSIGELFLANGSRLRIFSSEKPNRLRGPQHHFAWGDEPATWYDAAKGPTEDTTWANLEIGCRLPIGDAEPQILLTGTPKPVRLLTQRDGEPLGILHRETTAVTRGHTDENLENLASSYRERVVDPLRGTRLGRQELDAELLEDVEGALWTRAQLDRDRVACLPEPWAGWQRTPVCGLDPADGGGGAEHAYTVAGLGMDHELYVVENKGMRASPSAFVTAAVEAARRWGAMIVVERNHGGAWLIEVVERVLKDMHVRVPYKTVWAAEGKRTRAEPVATLSEQGHVHHVGYFPELEDQQVSFTGAPNERSPDRLDSYVWTLSEFTGLTFRAPSLENTVVPYSDQITDPTVVPWADEPRAGLRSLPPDVGLADRWVSMWGR